MKRAAILLSGLLLLTGCTAQEESISQHGIKKIKVTPEQRIKSKYGELSNEDKEKKIAMAGEMYLMLPAPEIENLGIFNNGPHTYLVSSEFIIEEFVDESWYEVPLPEETAFDGKTVYIGPGGRYHQNIRTVIDKKIYKREGKYRLVKVLKSKEKNQEDVVLAHVLTIGGKN